MKDLIKKMMNKEPVHRITLPEIKVVIAFHYSTLQRRIILIFLVVI